MGVTEAGLLVKYCSNVSVKSLVIHPAEGCDPVICCGSIEIGIFKQASLIGRKTRLVAPLIAGRDAAI